MAGYSIAPAPSGMNLRGMRDYTYALADEVPNGVFPSKTVDGFINAGVKMVARTVPTIPSIIVFDSVPNTPLYELPNALIEGKDSRVGEVVYDGTPLLQVDLYSLQDRSTTGTPSNYYVRGAFIGLYPTPVETGSVEVEYETEPEDLVADTDTPGLSVTAREAACIYAAYRMKLRDDEYSAADRLKADFDRILSSLAGPRAGVYKA